MNKMQLTHFMNEIHLMLYMAEEYIQMYMHLYTDITYLYVQTHIFMSMLVCNVVLLLCSFFKKNEEILRIEISLEESVFLLAVFVIKHGFHRMSIKLYW